MPGESREPLLPHALLPFVTGVLGGGVVGTLAGAATAALAVAAAVAVLALALAYAGGRVRVVLAAAALGVGVSAVAAVVRAGPHAPDHIVRHAFPEPTAIEGRLVASERTGSGAVRLTLRAERRKSVRGAGVASGLLRVTVAHPSRVWAPGALVRVVGRLRLPRNFCNPGGYDFERALARRGIFVTLFLWDDGAIELLAPPPAGPSTVLAAVRARMDARIAAVADEPKRGYLAAVLLGAGGAVDAQTRRMLARTGLAHILSVSGFHVAVAAASGAIGARWLLRRSAWLLLRWNAGNVAALAGLVPVLAYAGIAGGSVPATRAVLMYAGLLAALFLDRPVDALRALAAAALVLAAATPDIAADISFQLSFVAVAALVLAARWVGLVGWTGKSAHGGEAGAPGVATARRGERGAAVVSTVRGGGQEMAGQGPLAAFARRALARLVLQPLGVTLAATTATAPLLAWHFQQVSLVAPLANILALPLLGPATLVPGLAALPLLAAAPWLADALLRLAAGAAGLGLSVAAVLAAIPGAAVATPMPSALEVALCYLLLLLPFVPAGAAPGRLADGRRELGGDSRWARAWRPRRALACVLTITAIADIGYWVRERTANPNLRITYLSVGNGDAAVVELPRRGVIAIDGGGFFSDFDTGERLVAPFLRWRKIMRLDALVLSHSNLDHYGGLAYLAEHFAPREFWSNGATATGERFARLERALAAAGARHRVLRRGAEPIALGAVRIEVLSPGERLARDANDDGLVLRLAFGDTAFLFTGDIARAAEAELIGAASPLASSVIKVAHHGSRTSTAPELLAAVAPRIAVISVGADSRFGHPSPQVLARLAAAGAEVWRTDRDGAVRIESDGARLSVSASCSRRRGFSSRRGAHLSGQL